MAGRLAREERESGAAAERLKRRPFVIRPMEERDLNQAAEVEKDAFPTLFPTTSFRRELRNKIARYLVLARRDEGDNPTPGLPPMPDSTEGGSERLLGRIASGARRIWRQRNPSWRPGEDLVAGFAGLWYVADEAHLVSIGARTEYRGIGLGEELLITALEQATELEAQVMTLEVRVSNGVAQNLYRKYGFAERGIRKGYYSDNREDALIMTTPPIQAARYRRRLGELTMAHERRWGRSERRAF